MCLPDSKILLAFLKKVLRDLSLEFWKPFSWVGCATFLLILFFSLSAQFCVRIWSGFILARVGSH